MNIAVLSNSQIKKNAILNVFDSNKYNITFFEIKDNPMRETQPLFISGTIKACELRFNEFENQYPDHNCDTVISIENGIVPIFDNDNKNYSEMHWCDFCVIGISTKQHKKYIFSPVFINIEKLYTQTYFSEIYKKNKILDTFGKYIESVKNIPHNNWMKYMYNVDRTDQIISGLKKLIL